MKSTTQFVKKDDFGKSTHIEENNFKGQDWLNEFIRIYKAY